MTYDGSFQPKIQQNTVPKYGTVIPVYLIFGKTRDVIPVHYFLNGIDFISPQRIIIIISKSV